MKGAIVSDPSKCVGCQSCMLACSLTKENVFNPSKSRIQILRNEGLCLAMPIVCEQCEFPPCMDVCPVGAISKDPNTGVVNIDASVCNGCGACANACYYGAVRIDQKKNTAFKCDLCNGDPKCVKVCTFSGAIKYVKGEQAEVLRAEQSADKSAKAYLINVIAKEV